MGYGIENELGSRTIATVVLRVVLDARGDLSHGEIVDASSHSRERFADWEELVVALRSWLDDHVGESP